MKIITKLTGLLALALAGVTAQANTFNFSYVFGDGVTTVTGSLNGDQNGIFVENITNVSVSFNGEAMPGTVFTSQFDADSFSYLPGAIVSFDALQNNFFFANSDLAGGDVGYDSIFYLLNASVFMDTAVASSTLGYASQDAPIVTSSWSLSAAPGSSVPDQGTTLGLFGFSLGALVWVHRRSRSGWMRSTAVVR
jgi:hypothetical protein